MTRTYQVWMKNAGKCIEVQAGDVNLEAEGQNAFWNFVTEAEGDEDAVTVGAFPYASVEYIVSVGLVANGGGAWVRETLR